ncbi:unnamed protein product [Miscanthus lutarioriparius]|uniref:Uncharacterized protein n=1 Tax=Miscanthus lutarioriparius TaxID=422564 RepID=A0A811NSW8_9POAL|nr:unnamed protein product [Miscanthus lutarioriparius]
MAFFLPTTQRPGRPGSRWRAPAEVGPAATAGGAEARARGAPAEAGPVATVGSAEAGAPAAMAGARAASDVATESTAPVGRNHSHFGQRSERMGPVEPGLAANARGAGGGGADPPFWDDSLS